MRDTKMIELTTAFTELQIATETEKKNIEPHVVLHRLGIVLILGC